MCNTKHFTQMATGKRGVKLHCVCRQPFHGSMIQCFGCEDWYHPKCTDCTETEIKTMGAVRINCWWCDPQVMFLKWMYTTDTWWVASFRILECWGNCQLTWCWGMRMIGNVMLIIKLQQIDIKMRNSTPKICVLFSQFQYHLSFDWNPWLLIKFSKINCESRHYPFSWHASGSREKKHWETVQILGPHYKLWLCRIWEEKEWSFREV